MPRIVSILFSMLLLLAACTGGAGHRALSHAEAIMEQYPDSALAILDSISPSALPSEASRAKYALLHTQACFKSNSFSHNDSLIDIAVNYYKGKGTSDEMKSLFYLGNVRYYNSEYTGAIIPALRAHDLAVKSGDDYWRAKTAEQIADIYTATYFDDYEYRKEAIDYYNKAGRVDNHRYAICDMAIRYGNKNNPGKAVWILDSISRIAKSEHPVDSGLIVYSLYPLIPIYLKLMQTDSAYAVYNELLKYGDLYKRDMADYEYLAEIELNRNNKDTAFDILSQLLAIAQSNIEKLSVYGGMAKYYKKTEDVSKALDYTDSILKVQNEETHEILKQSIIAKQRDELKSIAISEKEKANNRLIIICLVAIISIIIIVGSFVFYSQKKRENNLIIRNKINELYILSTTIEHQKDNLDTLERQLSQKDELQERLNDTVRNLFREKWSTINLLCQQLYHANSSKDDSKIIQSLENEIKKQRSPQNISVIEDAVNLYMDNIIYRLRNQCTFLKSDEITILTLIIAGFSSKAICMLTGIDYKYFYVKKNRLLNKIKESDAIDKALFESFLI